jgi:hypothetical protein
VHDGVLYVDKTDGSTWLRAPGEERWGRDPAREAFARGSDGSPAWFRPAVESGGPASLAELEARERRAETDRVRREREAETNRKLLQETAELLTLQRLEPSLPATLRGVVERGAPARRDDNGRRRPPRRRLAAGRDRGGEARRAARPCPLPRRGGARRRGKTWRRDRRGAGAGPAAAPVGASGAVSATLTRPRNRELDRRLERLGFRRRTHKLAARPLLVRGRRLRDRALHRSGLRLLPPSAAGGPDLPLAVLPSTHNLRVSDQSSGTSLVEWLSATGALLPVLVGLVALAVTFWRRPNLTLEAMPEHSRVERDPSKQAASLLTARCAKRSLAPRVAWHARASRVRPACPRGDGASRLATARLSKCRGRGRCVRRDLSGRREDC